MATHDLGHKLTDKELAALEKRIAGVYKDARDGLNDTISEYFAKFAERDKHQQELLKAGKITEEQYKQWRLNQIGRGKRYEALRDEIAKRYTDANQVAASYVNDATPGIYSLNRNYAAYTIEKEVGNVGFNLFDEQTVKRLIVEEPNLMPYYPKKRAVARGIDLAWGKQQITASVTSGILQGYSVGKIADDLQDRMEKMNRASALRTARTAITGAQNAGRQDSYIAAEKMGIKMKREWLATLDGRTRHAHAVLDGQRVGVNEPFKVDGYEIMFPGDPTAKAYLVYNCRCTLIAAVDGVDTSDAQRRARDPDTGESVLIEDMTYSEWAGWKEKKEKAVARQAEEPQASAFTPAKTTEEAQQYADRFVSTYKSSLTGSVDYSGIDVAYANEMNRAFTEVFDAYDTSYPLRNIKPFNMREKRFKGTTAEAAYQWGAQDMFYNKAYYKTQKAFSAHAKQAKELLDQVLPNLDSLIAKYENDTSFSGKKTLSYLKAMKNTGRSNVYMADAYGTTIHEMGHYLDDSLFHKMFSESGFDLNESFSMYSGGISGYATSSKQEYIAESFAAYWKGETDIIDPELLKIFEGARKK